MTSSKATEIGRPLQIGDVVHDFVAQSTHGEIRFREWIAGSWTLFTTHPVPFTPVCSTELIAEARRIGELYARGVKAITLAAGTLDDQRRWVVELKRLSGVEIDFPIIADTNFAVSDLYGFRARAGSDVSLARTALIIDPEGIVRWAVTYPPRTGRNFGEVVRVLDSVLFTAKEGLASPAEWSLGESLLLPPSITTEEGVARYGAVDVQLPYLRAVKVPDEGRLPRVGAANR